MYEPEPYTNQTVNQILQNLNLDIVFVGGATVELYVTNSTLVPEVRPTEDVDVLVELITYSDYTSLDERLLGLGFSNDVESGVLCRYRYQGLIVDIMPTQSAALGFSNKWYPDGFKNAIEIKLDDRSNVRIFSLPFFIATKWEAFKSRGKNSYRTSKDFEDLVYLFENVEDFDDKIREAPEKLLQYFTEEFKVIIDSDEFEEGLYCHITGGYSGFDAGYIIARLKSAFGF